MVVTTRSAAVVRVAATAQPAFNLLYSLAEYGHGELLDGCATATLAVDLPSLLRLCQTSTTLRGRLAVVRAVAALHGRYHQDHADDTDLGPNAVEHLPSEESANDFLHT